MIGKVMRGAKAFKRGLKKRMRKGSQMNRINKGMIGKRTTPGREQVRMKTFHKVRNRRMIGATAAVGGAAVGLTAFGYYEGKKIGKNMGRRPSAGLASYRAYGLPGYVGYRVGSRNSAKNKRRK